MKRIEDFFGNGKDCLNNRGCFAYVHHEWTIKAQHGKERGPDLLCVIKIGERKALSPMDKTGLTTNCWLFLGRFGACRLDALDI